MALEVEARILGKLVDAPVAVLFHFHHAAGFQVAQMFGDIDLRLFQHRLEMADAEWRPGEEMQDAEARFVTETFVNLDQLHRSNMPAGEYRARTNAR